jgi:hypothetical protein
MHTAAEVGDVLQKIEALSQSSSAEKKKLSSDRIGDDIAEPSFAQTTTTRAVGPAAVQSSTQPVPTTPKFSARPTFTRSSNAKQTPTPLPTNESGSTQLSASEVSARWAEFVGEVRRQRIAVGTALDSATFVGVTGATIRVRANEFTSSAISRNRELLGEIIQKVFGARGRIEVEIGNEKKSPIMLDVDSNNSSSSEPPPPDEEHPVIKAMIRELGAEPI